MHQRMDSMMHFKIYYYLLDEINKVNFLGHIEPDNYATVKY